MPGHGYVELVEYSTSASSKENYNKGTLIPRAPENIYEVEDFSAYTQAQKILEILPKGRELGLGSRFRIGNDVYHMRMADSLNYGGYEMFTRTLDKWLPDKSYKLLVSTNHKRFHAYGPPLKWEDMVKWFGQILIPDRYNNTGIDTGWVGHCLNKGYAVLRISNNVKSYLPSIFSITSTQITVPKTEVPY